MLAGVNPADFYSPTHQHIAETIIVEHVSGHSVDVFTIAAALRDQGLLDTVGGPATLTRLQAETPATSSAARYAEIVVTLARRRRTIHLADELTVRSRAGHDIDDLLVQLTDAQARAGADELELEDIALALNEDFVEEPTVLCRDDGSKLLYEAATNVIQSEPTHGKSWLALIATTEILHAGGHVLYLDYEDNLQRIARRLLSLGATLDEILERFHYKRLDKPLSPAAVVALPRLARSLTAQLVVIDGLAEALASQGFDEDRAGEVVAWWGAFPRPIAATGACVLILDHVTKSKETRGRWARGSGAKLGALDGVAYGLEPIEKLSRKKPGRLKLVISKDRPGVIGAEGETAAIVNLTPLEDGERLTWTTETYHHDEWQGPTDCMAMVKKYFTEHPDQEVSRSNIGGQLKALYNKTWRDTVVREAAERLLLDGVLIVRTGARNSRYFRLNKDQADLDAELPLDEVF